MMFIQIILFLVISYSMFDAMPHEQGMGLFVCVATGIMVFMITVMPWIWYHMVLDWIRFYKHWKAKRANTQRLKA